MTSSGRTGNVTARAVRPLLAGLDALGVPSRRIAREAGVGMAALDDPDGRIAPDAMRELWQRALDTTGDECLGIHLAESAPLSTFDVHAYAMLSSRSLRDAYMRACRYQRLLHDSTRLTFEEEGARGTLTHAFVGGRAVSRHPAEFLATAWLRIGRHVVGHDWLPEALYFAHEAPSDTREHRRVFDAPVHFRAGRNAMAVRSNDLDRASKAGDEILASILDRHVATILATRPEVDTLAGRVRGLVADRLSAGETRAAGIASRLGMSERSLRRGLKSEGTSFREILDGMRHERAVALLSFQRCSIAEVAFLVGFSELGTFYRAFRRWTGSTPVEFRAGGLGRIGQ